MKPTPSPLKWMAEKRARTLGAFERAVVRADALNANVARLQGDLAALDQTIVVWNARLNPTKIDAIHAWKGRYGSRGALRDAIADYLKCEPTWVATSVLEEFACRQFGIAFEFTAERSIWRRHSLLGALRYLLESNQVERRNAVGGRDAKQWRWKQEKLVTLADLRAEADAPAPSR